VSWEKKKKKAPPGPDSIEICNKRISVISLAQQGVVDVRRDDTLALSYR
jgi:hypothetical protein